MTPKKRIPANASPRLPIVLNREEVFDVRGGVNAHLPLLMYDCLYGSGLVCDAFVGGWC